MKEPWMSFQKACPMLGSYLSRLAKLVMHSQTMLDNMIEVHFYSSFNQLPFKHILLSKISKGILHKLLPPILINLN